MCLVLVAEDVHGDVKIIRQDHIVVNHHTVLHVCTLVERSLVNSECLVSLTTVGVVDVLRAIQPTSLTVSLQPAKCMSHLVHNHALFYGSTIMLAPSM